MSTAGLSMFTFLQNFSLLGKYDVPWSGPWNTVLGWTLFIMMDLERLRQRVPVLQDWRTQFTFISVVAPLLVGFLALLLCYRPIEVVLYFIFFGFLAVAISGFVAFQYKADAVFGSSTNVTNIIVGCSGAGVCVLVFLIYRKFFRDRRPRRTIQDMYGNWQSMSIRYANGKQNIDERCVEETREFSRLSAGIKVLAILICCGGGAVLAGWTGTWDVLMKAYQWGNFLVPLGLGIFALGCVIFLYFLLTLSHKGRQKIWNMKRFLEHNFLKLLLFVATVMYLPIVANILETFNCANITCPAGTRFPDDVMYPYISGRADVCQNCTFFNDTYVPGPSANLSAALCPGATGRRLRFNYCIECDSVTPFFTAAAALMLASFAIGLPALFYHLIRRATRRLWSFPLGWRAESESLTGAQRWKEIMLLSENASSALYSPFNYRWRYWRLFDILYKLLVLLITVYVSFVGIYEMGFVALVVIGALHFAMFIFILALKPHARRWERYLALMVQFILVINYGIAAALVAKAFTEEQARTPLFVLLILNAICLACSLILIILLLRDKSSRQVAAETADAMASTHRIEVEPTPGADLESGRRSGNDEVPVGRRGSGGQGIVTVEQRTTDFEIDQATKQTIARYFIGACFVAFAALALCFTGIMYRIYTSNIILSRPFQFEVSRQFVGYSNWTDFTSNCGCMNASLDFQPYSEERWVCLNQRVVFRRRQQRLSDGFHTGLFIRPFCGSEFYPWCNLSLAGGITKVTCPLPHTELTKDPISDFAMEQLW